MIHNYLLMYILVPIETVGSSDGSDSNDISNPGTLRFEDHESSVLPNPNTKFDFNQHHERSHSQGGSFSAVGNKMERKGSQDIIDKESDFQKKFQLEKINGASSSIPYNIDSSYMAGTRSSFGSTSRSNTSSLGTNGTNNSYNSRSSMNEAQNMHPVYPPRSSPNTSMISDSFAPNMDNDGEIEIAHGRKVSKDSELSSSRHVNEYLALNNWNAEPHNMDNIGQSGSLSSFSSSSGSNRNRPPSNRSSSSAERK